MRAGADKKGVFAGDFDQLTSSRKPHPRRADPPDPKRDATWRKRRNADDADGGERGVW